MHPLADPSLMLEQRMLSLNGERSRDYKLVSLLIIFLGVFLRLYQINYNLEHDEIFSVQAATGSFSHVIEVSIQDRVHPPLYYILLYFWIKAFGSSEISVRLLSVLASVVFLVVLYRLALRLSTGISALFVILICAVSPFFVLYGEQARPYSLASCFVALSFYFLIRCGEKPSYGIYRVLYALSCAALVYSQFIGVLILLPQFGFIIISKLPNKWKLLSYGSAGMLSILFWIGVMGGTIAPASLTGVNWISRPVLAALPAFYIDIFGWFSIKGSSTMVLLDVIFLLVLVSVMASIVVKHRSIDLKLAFTLISLALLAPVSVWLISRYGPKSFWAPRQLIGSGVFFTLLIGIGIGLHRQRIGVILGSVLVIWSISFVPKAFPENSKPPWRTVAGLLGDRATDEDIVGEESWIVYPLRYYSKKNRIYYLSEYEGQLDTSARVVFVCRPSNCEKLEMLIKRYRIVDEEVVNWGGRARHSPDTIKIYFLERMNGR